MLRQILTRGASAGAITLALLPCAQAQTPLPQITIGAARPAASGAGAATPAAASAPAPALAQPDQRSDAETLDQREIAAERPATTDTVLLLRNTPGVSWYEAGGVSRLPVIHGLADDRLNVLVSGIPLASACANHMNPPLSYIAPSQVGKVQVYSGVAPVSVGGDSIGGAILVEPPPPAFAAAGQPVLLKGEVGSFYRSNGNGYGGHLSATAATDRFSVTYNGSYARSENYHAAAAFKPAGYAFSWNPLPLTRWNQFVPWLSGSEVGSTAFQSQNHDVSLAFRHENHQLQVNLGFQHIPYQNFPNQRMDMTLNRSVQGNVRYTGQYDWGLLEGQFYHQTARHGMDFGRDKMYFYGALNNILAPGMPMETKAQNTGVKVKADIDVAERHKLRVGAEYQQYRYNEWWPPSPFVLPPGKTSGGMAPAAFIAINNGQRDRFDVFAELESRWSSEWLTLVGVRSDTVWMNAGPVHGYNVMMYDSAPLYPATTFNLSNRGRTDQNWNATAQATYTPNATQTYSLGYSLKSRSPNLYERYSWSPASMPAEMIGWFGDGNFYIGNLNLKSEVANTISATADWHDPQGRMGLRFTPYFTYVSNFIDVQRCPLYVCGNTAALRNNLTTTYGFVYLQFVNQDARLFGADLSGHAVLAKDTPLGDFTARGILSYVNGQNITTGGNLYQIMPINAKLSLEQKLGGWTNVVETQLVGAKKNIEQARNELKTGAYALFNWRSSYEWRNIRFDVGVENIFNAFYYQPLGGAYIGYGATMSGNGAGAPAWGIPVPGMGRTVYVATNVKF
ncbi:MAG: TonB-dependent receptor [Methylocystis sp.]